MNMNKREREQKFHVWASVLTGTLVSNVHVSQFQPITGNAAARQDASKQQILRAEVKSQILVF